MTVGTTITTANVARVVTTAVHLNTGFVIINRILSVLNAGFDPQLVGWTLSYDGSLSSFEHCFSIIA